MKKLFFIFALFFAYFFNVNAQKDKLDQLFEKYQDTEGVTSIKIAKPMFSMLNKLDIDDAGLDQIKPLLNKINGLKILMVENSHNKEADKNGTTNLNSLQNLQNEISNSLKNLHYEELMSVNSKDNKIKFLSSDAANGVLDNLLLSINSEGNTILMMLDGKISMDDVNNLANEAQKTSKTPSKNSSDDSDEISEDERKVGNFSGIKVSSGIKLSFTQGSSQKVMVETNKALQKYVKSEVVGDILNIYVENPKNENLNFQLIAAEITAPEVNKIAVNQAANFTSKNTLTSDYFQIATTTGGHLSADIKTSGKVELSATSGSSLKMNIKAKQLEMSATSGSDAVLTGNTDKTNFSVSSAANVNAQDLVSKISMISATSASAIKVNVAEKITASITSKANVRYRDNPKLQRNAALSSGGTIKSF